MYLSRLKARNFRMFGDGTAALDIRFQQGLTAIVGRNDSGKSAVIDAIRYCLLTRDQEFIRVEQEDFHITNMGKQATEIQIVCKFIDLTDSEKGALLEYLSYESDDVVLYVTWTARKLSDSPGVRRWLEVYVRSGIDGTGPQFELSVRELLSAAYLRPLRDAEREMSSGRGSRLSQILANVPEIQKGDAFDEENVPPDPTAVADLNLVGLLDYMRHSVKAHTGVQQAQSAINKKYLQDLSLHGDALHGSIDVSQGGTEKAKLRQILERLELGLLDATTQDSRGHYGLGSNNLLFMACELLLLGKMPDGLPLLLIEEPEAHLHPQRQLRLVDFLRAITDGRTEASDRRVQVILSTHSPNLASKIPLGSLVLLDHRHAYNLTETETKLSKGDYRFLERFLDVTKANLFFAHGVLIVEGDSEALLLPTLAKLMGKDLTEHGISIVNVGGRGLRRFSGIFQRAKPTDSTLNIPVACVSDEDVMPDCAPKILGLVKGDDDDRWQSKTRRWRSLKDFGGKETERTEMLSKLHDKIRRDDEQSVRTFIADAWTFEYALALSGLDEDVYVAACLAKNDDPLNDSRKTVVDVMKQAKDEFGSLKTDFGDDDEVLCTHVYRMFHSGGASKAVAAQHLAALLEERWTDKEIDTDSFRECIPKYISQAIDYVTAQRPEDVNNQWPLGDQEDG